MGIESHKNHQFALTFEPALGFRYDYCQQPKGPPGVLPSKNQSSSCDRRRIYRQRVPPEVARREVLKACIRSPVPKPTLCVAGKTDAKA